MPSNGKINEITIEDKNQYLLEHIRKWAVQFNVSHGCANAMLNILRTTGLEVPKDIRTILCEHKVMRSITEIKNGSYLDLGIVNIIKPHLVKHIFGIPNNITIKLSFNIDGLPLAKSSKTQFWPILLSFINLPIFSRKIFPVGIYHSFKSKPGDVNEFLKPFINELNTILNFGIQIENKQINFEIAHIVSDAPAKAFLLKVKNHNGYFACTSCEVEGEFIDKVCFLDMSAPLRTNESFRLKSNSEYHKDGFSPLIDLPIDIINSVVLDMMHCVCQGVMKRLLEFWVKGKLPVRVLEQKKNFISSALFNLRKFVPSEFARLPRSLDDLEFWKATEFREFLLYTGVIVLKSNLKREQYDHFLLLFISIRILCSNEICFKYNNLASTFLIQFVRNYSSIYGAKFISYNVHSLIHLPFFVNLHGPLDNYSAFKYENYLQTIKRSMKCCRYPLSEINNKILAIESDALKSPINNNICILDSFKINENISNSTITYYTKIIIKSNNYVLRCDNIKDQVLILKNDEIVIIKKIYKNNSKNDSIIKLSVVRLLTVSDLFLEPVSSKLIGVFLVNSDHVSNQYDIILNDIKFKCFFVQLTNNKAIVISLCHNII